MNRQAQAVVMLLLGGAALKASLTDMYLRYVKESLRPFLIAASLLLIAAALTTLWYELRPARRAAEPAGHDHGAGHTHGAGAHREPRIGWFLIAPVLGLLLVAPPALGSYAAGQSGTALSNQSIADFPPLPDEDPAPLSVLDYAARAVFEGGESLAGRNVQLTGFVLPGEDGTPYLARIILSCCAADGRPIKVGLAGDAPVGVAADTWIEAVGTYTDQVATDPINGATIPYLTVLSWRQIAAPAQQYE